jgi:glycosyltransferase involved in cell wall biosynthesis
MRILLVIRSLNRGGAERQLIEIAAGLRHQGHDVAVALFYEGGSLTADLLRVEGVRIHVIGKRGRWDLVGLASRLVHIVAEERPDLIHSLLTTANIATLIARARFARLPLVWGILGTDLDSASYGDWFVRFTTCIEGPLARCANLIVSDSHVGRVHAIARGFPADRTIVIQSGADLDRFRPDAEGRRRIRAEWGIAPNEILVGLVARMAPMKDHATFLRAAASLAAVRRDVRFVCIGDENASMANSLRQLAATLNLGNRLVWPGPCDDMPAAYSALDVGCSSSASGEGFSNALMEAMACGRLCVATDVGDAPDILGNLGATVPPRDPSALASSLTSVCDALGGPAEFHAGTRQRMVDLFSRDRMVTEMEAAYRRLLNPASAGAEGAP